MAHRLRPGWHAFDGSKQSAHEDKDHYEKERNEHRLLLSFGIRGDQ
jgi:hypothetical protein